MLTDQLKDLEGVRVEVVDLDGNTRRFTVGLSQCGQYHVEMKRRDSLERPLACLDYKSVKPLYSSVGVKEWRLCN